MKPSDGAGAMSKDKRVRFADTDIGHTGNKGDGGDGDHGGDNVPDGDGSYGDEGNRRQRVMVDTAYNNNPKSREELVRVVNKQLEAWAERFRTDEGHHERHQEENRRAMESLPTAQVRVGGEWRNIKLDTGTQFCVAGESWKEHGERLGRFPPVDFVEGSTGAVAKGEGVWQFRFKTQYGQAMVVDALVVEDATEEFLLGEDWMMQNGVKIDFISCEMKWYVDGDKRVVPFSCTKRGKNAGRAVRDRLVQKQQVTTGTCRRVELAVAAPEGTEGLFMPALGVEPHLMLAPTLARVSGGKFVVPVMNLVGRTAKLPAQEM
ncbi:unnamed protein product [Phytophthora fragariaefolia]|uniref:Unnamed protein product n=1 Tax=Phytophthora fragariaefolia TaxID=1490495 RepID=A0A9W6YFX8_9STRA|nr:unnamed protein product [Phytophthora fragariaefolia]